MLGPLHKFILLQDYFEVYTICTYMCYPDTSLGFQNVYVKYISRCK